jgi:hypothetical protein
MTKAKALDIRDRGCSAYISLVTSGTLYEPFLMDRVKRLELSA